MEGSVNNHAVGEAGRVAKDNGVAVETSEKVGSTGMGVLVDVITAGGEFVDIITAVGETSGSSGGVAGTSQRESPKSMIAIASRWFFIFMISL
jgi:hypothetical protein